MLHCLNIARFNFFNLIEFSLTTYMIFNCRLIGKPYNISSEILENAHFGKKVMRRKEKRQKNINHSLGTSLNSHSLYKMNKRNRRFAYTTSMNNQLQIFSPTEEQLFAEFFEAINRKDDTFYLVSLSADHLLLPALHHNKTSRPKMSLLLPSMLSNGKIWNFICIL